VKNREMKIERLWWWWWCCSSAVSFAVLFPLDCRCCVELSEAMRHGDGESLRWRKRAVSWGSVDGHLSLQVSTHSALITTSAHPVG